MNDRIDRGSDYNLEWWKDKAVKRYVKLQQQKRLNKNNLWYESIDPNLFKSWLISRGV